MDRHQESDIISGLNSGDADAWRALYDAYCETVWMYIARRMMPHAADIPDVVQETFLAAAGSVSSYDSERGTLLNWLTGIAQRHIATYYRARRRQDRACQVAERLGAKSQQVIRWLGSGEPAPPAQLDRKELAALIRTALSRIRAEYEQLLEWKYLDGDKVEQIAARLSMSETAVRSKLARARRAFRCVFNSRPSRQSINEQGANTPHE